MTGSYISRMPTTLLLPMQITVSISTIAVNPKLFLSRGYQCIFRILHTFLPCSTSLAHTFFSSLSICCSTIFCFTPLYTARLYLARASISPTGVSTQTCLHESSPYYVYYTTFVYAVVLQLFHFAVCPLLSVSSRLSHAAYYVGTTARISHPLRLRP